MTHHKHRPMTMLGLCFLVALAVIAYTIDLTILLGSTP